MRKDSKKLEFIKKHGFSRTILGIKCVVFFDYFERATKATLIVNDLVYTGVAKLSKEDVYDRNTGEVVALSKALLKYERKYLKTIEDIKGYADRLFRDVNNSTMSTLCKLQETKVEGKCLKCLDPEYAEDIETEVVPS